MSGSEDDFNATRALRLMTYDRFSSRGEHGARNKLTIALISPLNGRWAGHTPPLKKPDVSRTWRLRFSWLSASISFVLWGGSL
ncbi:hypothetical protein DSO57_1038501 [Entomophthora muscae]|uniref:Uncharacterized protein n=1 Tax=Entomophthora muscae TaxID=34485 RepID=A0ACC2S0S9_9FUNG|nr:hypothetical protein DSO57_1038501 [Entomophthora muscae]